MLVDEVGYGPGSLNGDLVELLHQGIQAHEIPEVPLGQVLPEGEGVDPGDLEGNGPSLLGAAGGHRVAGIRVPRDVDDVDLDRVVVVEDQAHVAGAHLDVELQLVPDAGHVRPGIISCFGGPVRQHGGDQLAVDPVPSDEEQLVRLHGTVGVDTEEHIARGGRGPRAGAGDGSSIGRVSRVCRVHRDRRGIDAS